MKLYVVLVVVLGCVAVERVCGDDINDFVDMVQCGLTGTLNCESCTEEKGCYYCEKNNLCLSFHGDGTKAFFPDTNHCELNEVKWLQCALDYQAMLIIAAIVLVILLATFGCCCYCCCCR